MTTQEILTRVNDAIRIYDPVLNAENSSSCNVGTVAYEMHYALESLAADLEAQLRLETAAQNGTTSATKVLTKLLNALKKHDTRESLHYAWIDANGRQCICDGFQAYRLNDPLPLEPRPDDAGKPIDLDRVIPPNVEGWKRLPLPSVKELRSFIAVERAKNGGKRGANAVWSFGDHAPSVNADYLLNAVQVFPNAATIFWDTLVTPLVIRDESGDAVILPIRVSNKTQPEPANDAERQAMDAAKAFRDEQNAKTRAEVDERVKANREISELVDARDAAKRAWLAASAEAESAQDDAARSDARKRAIYAGREYAELRLRLHRCQMIVDPTDKLELDEFTDIITLLYAAA